MGKRDVSAKNDAELADEIDEAVQARRDELERQRAVEQAVYDATHDADGNPTPIVP